MHGMFLLRVLYSLAGGEMDSQTHGTTTHGTSERDALHAQIRRVSTRLKSAGLLGITDAFLSAFTPLAPLGAHMLWMLQPTLSAFHSGSSTLDELANVLDDPAGVEWIRGILHE
jgi:hypothetical protein